MHENGDLPPARAANRLVKGSRTEETPNLHVVIVTDHHWVTHGPCQKSLAAHLLSHRSINRTSREVTRPA